MQRRGENGSQHPTLAFPRSRQGGERPDRRHLVRTEWQGIPQDRSCALPKGDALSASLPNVEQLTDHHTETGQHIAAVERRIWTELTAQSLRSANGRRAPPRPQHPDLPAAGFTIVLHAQWMSLIWSSIGATSMTRPGGPSKRIPGVIVRRAFPSD